MDRVHANRPFKTLEVVCGWKVDVEALVQPCMTNAQQQLTALFGSKQIDNIAILSARDGKQRRVIIRYDINTLILR